MTEESTSCVNAHSTSSVRRRIYYLIEQLVARMAAVIWRWGYDRQAVSAFIGRYSAHFAIISLALLLGFAGRVALTPINVEGSPAGRSLGRPAAAEPVLTPTAAIFTDTLGYEPERPSGVVREANPLTTIPDRVRLDVITYTVQEGDHLFGIAEKFELSPYTIVWSNMEVLQGEPWWLEPGLTLSIPPVDGAYHTVRDGETVESIAADYEVSEDDIYNMWNAIDEGQVLAEGTLLVVPGGVGADFDWDPPPPEPVITSSPSSPSSPSSGSAATASGASGSWGYCGDTAVSGPGANGWFILPTGSYQVSGWLFHDPRNPSHIGLDYRCRLGDPIYAADSGVVIFAGWGGGYGNLVRVNHGNGFETRYAHFNGFAVTCGEPVQQGQLLGYCGTTGWSTGPHLHYEIRANGVPQNPKAYEP